MDSPGAGSGMGASKLGHRARALSQGNAPLTREARQIGILYATVRISDIQRTLALAPCGAHHSPLVCSVTPGRVLCARPPRRRGGSLTGPPGRGLDPFDCREPGWRALVVVE